MKGYQDKRDRIYRHDEVNYVVLAENKREATYVFSRIANRLLTMKGTHFVKVANKLERLMYGKYADPIKDSTAMTCARRHLTTHS